MKFYGRNQETQQLLQLDKRVTVGEVKRNEKKISLQTLEDKFATIRSHFRGYAVQFASLSLADM